MMRVVTYENTYASAPAIGNHATNYVIKPISYDIIKRSSSKKVGGPYMESWQSGRDCR